MPGNKLFDFLLIEDVVNENLPKVAFMICAGTNLCGAGDKHYVRRRDLLPPSSYPGQSLDSDHNASFAVLAGSRSQQSLNTFTFCLCCVFPFPLCCLPSLCHHHVQTHQTADL